MKNFHEDIVSESDKYFYVDPKMLTAYPDEMVKLRKVVIRLESLGFQVREVRPTLKLCSDLKLPQILHETRYSYWFYTIENIKEVMANELLRH